MDDDAIYRTALNKARAELEEVSRAAKMLEDRKEGLEKTVSGLVALLGDILEEPSVGLTEMISNLLEARRDTGFTPVAFRDYLRDSGFPIDSYKNPMAVIHTTLKRMLDQGRVKSWTKDNKTFYKRVALPAPPKPPDADENPF